MGSMVGRRGRRRTPQAPLPVCQASQHGAPATSCPPGSCLPACHRRQQRSTHIQPTFGTHRQHPPAPGPFQSRNRRPARALSPRLPRCCPALLLSGRRHRPPRPPGVGRTALATRGRAGGGRGTACGPGCRRRRRASWRAAQTPTWRGRRPARCWRCWAGAGACAARRAQGAPCAGRTRRWRQRRVVGGGGGSGAGGVGPCVWACDGGCGAVGLTLHPALALESRAKVKWQSKWGEREGRRAVAVKQCCTAPGSLIGCGGVESFHFPHCPSACCEPSAAFGLGNNQSSIGAVHVVADSPTGVPGGAAAPETTMACSMSVGVLPAAAKGVCASQQRQQQRAVLSSSFLGGSKQQFAGQRVQPLAAAAAARGSRRVTCMAAKGAWGLVCAARCGECVWAGTRQHAGRACL